MESLSQKLIHQTRRLRAIAVLTGIGLLTLTSFQNCGGGFQSNSDSAASTAYSQPGGAGDIPPVVSFTLSATAVTPGTSTTITVTATPQVNNVTISKVDFFVAGAKVKTLTTTPYTYQLTEQTQGVYAIYVQATDSLGGVTATNSQNLTVAAAGGTLAAECNASSYRAPSWGSGQTSTFNYNINLPAPDTTKQNDTLSFTSEYPVTNIKISSNDKNLNIASSAKNSTLTIQPGTSVECASGTATFTAQLQDQCAGLAGFTFPASSTKTFTVNYKNTCPAESRLIQTTPISQEAMGAQVASDGSVVVMTAPQFTNGAATNAGAAYVFAASAPNGSDNNQLAILAPSTVKDQKITSVAIKSGTLVLGTSPLPGVAGAAYVYHGSGANWTLAATIPQPTVTGQSAADPLEFGTSVQILADGSIAVGAPGEDVAGQPEAGAVHIYSGSTFAQITTLTASTPVAFEYLGSSMAVSGNDLVIGAPYRASLENTSLNAVGAAYVFAGASGSAMSQSARMTVTKVNATDVYQFGEAVSTDGTHVAVGAPLSGGGGAVFVFNMNGTPSSGPYVSGEAKNGNTPITAAGDDFGESVQISGSTVWVGAPGNTTSTGAIFKFSTATPTAPTFKLVSEAAHRAENSQFGFGFILNGSNIMVGSPGFTGLNNGVPTYVNSGIGFIIGAP